MVAEVVKEETGVRQFCDTAYRELTEMKAKAFDIICMVEKMPYEEGKIFRNRYFEFFDLVDYIEKRLDSLIMECPIDWRVLKEEIEAGKEKLSEAINWWDARHIAGGYVSG